MVEMEEGKDGQDGAASEQGEQAEDQVLQQIVQLCDSGNPQALPQIKQLVEGLLSHNQEEEKEMEGEQGTDHHAAMLEAVKNQMGG